MRNFYSRQFLFLAFYLNYLITLCLVPSGRSTKLDIYAPILVHVIFVPIRLGVREAIVTVNLSLTGCMVNIDVFIQDRWCQDTLGYRQFN